MSTHRPAALLGGLLLLSAPAAATDFTAGDLFLYSPAITGISSVDGAILRIDPVTGATSFFLDLWSTQSNAGSMAWDPYREGLVFCASLDNIAAPKHLWMVDGAGARTDLGQVGKTLYNLAPTPFGHIYHQGTLPADQIAYIDEFNQPHTLLDDTGSAPFDLVPGGLGSLRALIYDEGTHSLFAASGAGQSPVCAGGPLNIGIGVRRIPLSVDGTQTAGAMACAEFEISTSGESVTQWSRGPGGSLMLVVDTNSNSAENRMLLVDPVTMAISVYASNGSYIGAAATNAGTYSTARTQCVILDTGTDVLRAFSSGGSGAGTIIPTTMQPSPTGSSGETAILVEVPGGGCDGTYASYGAGLAGTGGFVPLLFGSNCPEIGKAITIVADDVRGGAIGALFLGTTQASLPFKGGQLLVFPILITLDIVANGTPGSSGVGTVTLPTLIPNDPLWIGLEIDLQAGFADPVAPVGVSLTNGLAIDVG